MGAVHQVDEGQVVLRFDQVDVWLVSEQAIDRFAHVGVEVHGVEDLYVRVFCCGVGQGMADALEASTKAFAAVTGDQDEFFAGVEEAELLVKLGLQFGLLQFLDHFQQGVDDGVAGDLDAFCRNAFA